ncbi:NUDIX hydrolase [Candidatus Deianiraea vastatrix]|uniref:RppH-like NUDIX hydrolase n=1 Tax=Candidatus Deianiraea vastatrix TaxID=2163644 RepID=A0A5B8XGG1_9RICK|nr:NUDIX hydrolase [Candidatus Deianiraea vastatrix]QED23301.1 Putative RppH-like NUDIX hydrolase [Candidatus Deianiraea vastatrix]
MKKIFLLLAFLLIICAYFIFTIRIEIGKKIHNIEPEKHGNAGCIIANKDGYILMSKGVKTKKYHIPGGTAMGYESPEDTAMRETFEEIGIKPTIVKLFALKENNFYIFFCKINEEYLDHEHVFEDEISGNEWVDVKNIDSKLLRYPSEYKSIVESEEFKSFVLEND